VLLAPLLAVALAAGSAAAPHHSFAATYDQQETIRIEGRIVQFQFRNPHSYVHVEAPDADGQVWRWAIEWGGTGQLGQQGVTSQTLQPGDEVTVTGNPGHNPGDHRLLMRTLHRTSDGFGWGQRPDEVFD
jgi:hypothetical protein